MPNRSFRLFRVAPNYSLSLPTHFYDSFSLSPLAIHTYIHTYIHTHDRSTGRLQRYLGVLAHEFDSHDAPEQQCLFFRFRFQSFRLAFASFPRTTLLNIHPISILVRSIHFHTTTTTTTCPIMPFWLQILNVYSLLNHGNIYHCSKFYWFFTANG